MASCTRRHLPPPPALPVHYVLEPAYQAGRIWFYPRETFSFAATGLAVITAPGHPAFTTDNEAYDPNAMAAGMQAVQLPAIATVTNLQTGRRVDVRVNDRGPVNPGRLIELTPRVAALLGMTAAPAQVEIQFDPVRSAALSRQYQGHAADIGIDAAPRGTVQQATLAPLAGTGQEARRAVGGPAGMAQVGETADVAVPMRLPEAVTASPPDPGTLVIAAGDFSREVYARLRMRQVPDVDVRLQRASAGGQTTYSVVGGPYSSVSEADAALDRMIRDGITDAAITVQQP